MENMNNNDNVERHTGDNENGKRRPCHVCGKVISSHKSTYMRHVENHTYKEQQHECNQCHKMFKSKHYLQMHSVTHSGIRIPCTTCKKTFSSKSNLSQHIRIVHE